MVDSFICCGFARNIETPGEDPYLTGQYAIHFTKGMQESPDDPSHIQASACCKHFVANSLESSYGPQDTSWNRENDDAAVTMQDLVDSYMLPFQACVEQGRVSGLMCSCKRLMCSALLPHLFPGRI